MAPFLGAAVLALGGAGVALAVGETTGTVSVCSAASVPAHTVQIDGAPVSTIAGASDNECATTTYTIPTVTQTVTDTVTTTVGTTTAPPPDPTFVSSTDWARPSPSTPSAAQNAGWHLVPFTDKASLDSAISGMQPNDYIYYNGTGVLTISSSSGGFVDSIVGHNPSGRVVIDFGTSHSVWDSSTVSANYVKFAYTGTGNSNALWLSNDSNLTIFGGDFTDSGGAGVLFNAPISNVTWEDGYLHAIAGSGIAVRGNTSAGAASEVTNLTIRAEVAGFALNPVYDTHPDVGTGNHALILHGSNGSIDNSTFAIDGHDPIPPGGRSLTGVVYPEGTGGACIEQGNDVSANYSNDTLYAGCANLLMEPGNGSNPGDTGTVQTGGNLFNIWGSDKLNGNVLYGWGTNLSGAMFHTDNGNWFPGSPPLIYAIGRASNTNQYTGGGNIAQPYPTTNPAGTSLGIVYQDVK